MTTAATRAAADLSNRPAEGVHLLTTETAPGHRVTALLGLVRGNTIRTRHIGHDITAVFKNMVGGEISEYTKMMAESREQALDRMRAEALERGANAVVSVRFTTSMITQGAAEIMAYGTAVRIEPIETD